MFKRCETYVEMERKLKLTRASVESQWQHWEDDHVPRLLLLTPTVYYPKQKKLKLTRASVESQWQHWEDDHVPRLLLLTPTVYYPKQNYFKKITP